MRFRARAGIVAALGVSAAVMVRGQTPVTAAEPAGLTRLVQAALSSSEAYDRLATLTDTFGNRLSGSDALEHAIDWILDQMRRDGLANVHGEPVTVPHWVRGDESATLVAPRALPLHMIGLGMSVGTPADGITAPVLVVRNFDELERRAAEAKGAIVVFDYPFRADLAPLDGYNDAVAYRSRAPVAAARAGAVAALIRSVSSFSIQNPHTGSTRYDPSVPSIPAAALSVEDTEMLRRMADRGQKVVLTLKMGAHQLPDAQSRNVVAELPGRESPDEVVVLGGHIDSWDVGQGAMDDGGCSVAAWEAVRLMTQLGLTPKRTVRVVLWTNEENGTRGGRAYRDAHAGELGKHVAAMECDNGVFRPYGFKFRGSDAGLAYLVRAGAALESIGAGRVVTGDPEADVTPLTQAGVPTLGLNVDTSKYFWFHHSAGDTIAVIDRDDLARCVAAMAGMAYLLADADQPVPR
jgi:carboxypeptidase Q